MTNQEFYYFDMGIFNEPGYENEKAYLGWLTTYTFLAINQIETQEKKSSQNEIIERWYKQNLTLRDMYSADKLPQLNLNHPKENEFINFYENQCTRFLAAFDKQYKSIYENQDNYYTAYKVPNQLVDTIINKTKLDGKVKLGNIVQAGFVDLRLSFIYSFENPESKEIIESAREKVDMTELYSSFDKTIGDFTRNYSGDIKPRTNIK